MKINIKELDEDSCSVCDMHKLANKNITGIVCPKCGICLNMNSIKVEVVGQNNGGVDEDFNDRVIKSQITECEHCYSNVAFLPTIIKYNANHDIYYTGEPCYLTDQETEALEAKLKICMYPSIEQFVQRLKDGDSLSAWNLQIWTGRDVVRTVAQFLYDYGYKRKII